MMCKDCIHVEVCREYVTGLAIARGVELNEAELEQVLVCNDCEHCADRSRFVELPDNFPKGRLTTDKPLENFDALMNYAFAKDGKVLLRYANDQENMDLCDYITFHAKAQCGINAEEVLDGACIECDDFACSLGCAYLSAVQAAELRARLKMYEDLAEQALKEREENEN